MGQIWQFIIGHEGIFAGLGVALLDLVFALNDKWKSNGVLHWIYVQLQALVQKPQPPAQ